MGDGIPWWYTYSRHLDTSDPFLRGEVPHSGFWISGHVIRFPGAEHPGVWIGDAPTDRALAARAHLLDKVRQAWVDRVDRMFETPVAHPAGGGRGLIVVSRFEPDDYRILARWTGCRVGVCRPPRGLRGSRAVVAMDVACLPREVAWMRGDGKPEAR